MLPDAGGPPEGIHRPGAVPTPILALCIEPRRLAMHRRSPRASAHRSFLPAASVTLTPVVERLSREIPGETPTHPDTRTKARHDPVPMIVVRHAQPFTAPAPSDLPIRR